MVSRRRFLQGGAASLGFSAFSLAPSSALASAFDSCGQVNQAIVGIDLAGGNDGFNMLIPSKGEAYEDYQLLRSELAISPDTCIALDAGDSAGLMLHPALELLSEFWRNEDLLSVLNVGPLTEPVTKESYAQVSLPDRLFSHSHQSSMVQSFSDTKVAKQGFGARTAWITESISTGINDKVPLFDIGGGQVWTNSLEHNANSLGVSPPNDIFNDAHGRDVTLFERLNRAGQTDSIYHEYFTKVAVDSRNMYAIFSEILDYQVEDEFPDSRLGKQLEAVFKLILHRDRLGQHKQYFSCKLGGFDTHSNQQATQHQLLTELAEALAAFHQALRNAGLYNDVISFTHSEFGRTLIPNATKGSDHGWGSHSLLLGGAIKGKQFIGTYPSLSSGSEQLLSRGRVIPTLSTDQVHASLMSWLGLRESGINTLFPTLHTEKGTIKPQVLDIFKDC